MKRPVDVERGTATAATKKESSMARAIGTRGRKPRQAKPEKLRDEAEKLRTRLAEIEAQEKQFSEQKQLVVGRAILLHADAEPDFRQKLTSILERTISNKEERKLLGLSAPTRRRAKKTDQSEPEARPRPERNVSDVRRVS
jgi:hypothetical protein